MKLTVFFLLIALSVTTAFAEPKKKVAMVFDGGGFKTAMFLGMLKGAEETGHTPDIIIGTCGGSIPAAIAHSIDGSEKQLEFVQSKPFYYLLRSIEFTNYSAVGKIISLAKNFYTKYKWQRMIPDIFHDYLMNVPNSFNLKEISKNFTPSKYRTVIVASRILYNEENLGGKRDKGENLFQESIFTDEVTAKELNGFIAPNSLYKNSSVASKVDFITDANLDEAARASISDPFYMAPGNYKGERYVTGAVDLYPIELAKKIADEIIFVYPSKFGVVEEGAIFATFNFSHNKRHRQVFHQKIDYLIDSTDFPPELELEPKLNLLAWKINSRVPQTYEEYREITRLQFEFGYKRALDASNNANAKDYEFNE